MKKTIWIRLLSCILLLSCLFGVVACTQTPNDGEDTTESVSDSETETDDSTTPEERDAELIKDGASEYKIVIKDDASETVKEAATQLSAAIFLRFGIYLPVVTEDCDKAIYVSVKVQFGDPWLWYLGAYGYGLSVKDGDFHIYAESETSLMYALAVVEKDYLKPNEAGNVIIPAHTCQDVTLFEKLTLADLIDMGLPVETSMKAIAEYGTVKVGDKTYKTAQGVATDGKYIYFVIKASEYSGVIVKLDFDGKQVAVSAPYDFGHANDITFDTKRNLVVVVHGSSTTNTANGNDKGRNLSFLNGDTLELVAFKKEVLASGRGAGAIDFNTETGLYTVGHGGKYIRQFTLDDSLNVHYVGSDTNRESESTEGRVGYVGQGMGGDNRYFYFPYSDDSSKATFDNLVVVYNSNREYVTTFHIDTGMESESMFYHDGRYFIGFNHNGAQIYELLYEPVYRAYGREFHEIDETIYVVRSSGDVYATDDRNSAKLEDLESGKAYHAVGFSIDKSWYRVKLEDGRYGFIQASRVMAADPATITDVSEVKTVTATTLNVRRRPDSGEGSHILAQLKKGAKVTVLGTIKDSPWVKIQIDSKYCFVHSSYLE